MPLIQGGPAVTHTAPAGALSVPPVLRCRRCFVVPRPFLAPLPCVLPGASLSPALRCPRPCVVPGPALSRKRQTHAVPPGDRVYCVVVLAGIEPATFPV